MHAGASHALADGEVVVALFLGHRSDSGHRRDDADVRLCFAGGSFAGGTWGPQALPRSQEGVLAHAVLPNQSEMKPECPARNVCPLASRNANAADQPTARGQISAARSPNK